MNKIIEKIIAGIGVIVMSFYLLPIYAFANSETVYSKLDAEGSEYKTIVTTKENGETTQQEIKEELPIETKITYKLDGKEIKAKDLAGKSGKVTIKIECENKSAREVMINGKKDTMYTPFVVALGTIIDNKNNKNIKISKGGEILENGDKSIAIGLVFPGLDKSLDLTGILKDIEIPSSIEVTMDATNFEQKNIMMYASPKVLTEDINWSKFDDLFSKVNELQNGINKIQDGAEKLSDGINQLDDGAEDLDDGVSKLNKGAGDLKIGAKSLSDGTEELKAGAKSLSDGTQELKTGAKSLNDGTQELKTGAKSLNDGTQELKTGAKSLNDGVRDAKNGVDDLKEGSGKLVSGAKSVDSGASSLKSGLNQLSKNTKELKIGMTQISDGIKSVSTNLNTINKKTSALGKQLTSYAGKVNDLKQLISVNKQYKEKATDATEKAIWQKNIDALEEELALLNNMSNISTLIDGIEKLDYVVETLNTKTKDLPKTFEDLDDGVKTLEKGATSLATGTSSMYAGIKTLDGGISKLSDGTKALVTGTDELYKGSKELAGGSKLLYDGSKELAEGSKSLYEGTKQVTTGSKSLYDGSRKLAEGSKSLYEGTISLTDGTKTLSQGTDSLKEGTAKLAEGSKELVDGIKTYNTSGINKICRIVNYDIKNLKIRAEKLEELSNDYNTFASDEKRDNIKFIAIIDSISNKEKSDDKKEN